MKFQAAPAPCSSTATWVLQSIQQLVKPRWSHRRPSQVYQHSWVALTRASSLYTQLCTSLPPWLPETHLLRQPRVFEHPMNTRRCDLRFREPAATLGSHVSHVLRHPAKSYDLRRHSVMQATSRTRKRQLEITTK